MKNLVIEPDEKQNCERYFERGKFRDEEVVERAFLDAPISSPWFGGWRLE